MTAARLLPIAAALASLPVTGSTQERADPFAFFSPTVTLTASEQQGLAQGQPLVKVLPADAHEIAVAAIVPTTADSERLVTWVRHIEQLKKSPAVLAIGRFSTPPVLADLNALTVSDEDLTAMRSCRPNSCDVKLTTPEITQVQQENAAAGADWKRRLTDAFRRLVLKRVETYMAGGHPALGQYSDGNATRPLHATFSAFLKRSPYLTQKLPRFTEYLERYPQPAPPEVQSFFYWSTERVGGKPATVAVHVSIWREPASGRAVVAGKQIMATHYMNGSLNVMTILPGTAGGPNYLVTVNRSEVDVLSGVFGGVARMVAERRVRSEAAQVLQGLRQRLESGGPVTSSGKFTKGTDEQHLVPALVEHELVRDAARDQHAESARTKPAIGTLEGGLDDLLGMARLSRVREIVAIETRTGVAEVIDDRTGGPRRGDLDRLLGIEACAMLHGIDEHLAKGRDQQVAVAGRQHRLILRHEPHEPLGREQMTGHPQRQPVREA